MSLRATTNHQLMNTKPIQEFISTNERNLRIAAAVAEAWPQVREHLVLGFFSRLGENVKKALPGWTFEAYGRFQTDECSGCCLTKPAWKGEYFVDLTCSGFGKRIHFGVSRAAEKNHVRERSYCEKVLTAVKEAFPSATARVWWEAKMTMHSPASDWRKRSDDLHRSRAGRPQ